jgi:hypothetical protein
MALLSDYEADTADLLHDPSNRIWTLAQLDRYINKARAQLVRDTGCLRTLQQSVCTQGQEAYTFGQVSGALITAGGSGYSTPTIAFSGGGGSGVAATLGVTNGAITSITFTSFGSGYTSAPSYVITGAGSGAVIQIGAINASTYDVLGISIYWGTSRYSLGWRAWSQFSAELRTWASYQQRPALWAVYGDTQFYLGPTPDQSYAMELDTIVLPTALTDYVTVDPIPVLAQDPIPFYAAYLAKFNERSYGEAEVLRGQYERKVVEVSGAYTRRIPDVYPTGFERR